MKKLILMWLFGTDDIDEYFDLLRDNMRLLDRSLDGHKKCLKEIESHRESLEREKEMLKMINNLFKVCENNGIDIDKEIRKVEFDD